MRDSGSPRIAELLVPLAFAAVVAASGLSGCQHFAGASCSGELADLEAAGTRDLHVRLELFREGSSRRHEVVVQVAPGHITAIGLTPLGTPAFRLSHGPEGIEVDNRIGRHLGYQPRRVYDAVVHAFLARRPAPDDPPVSAVVSAGPDGTHVENDRCGYSARLVLISDERA